MEETTKYQLVVTLKTTIKLSDFDKSMKELQKLIGNSNIDKMDFEGIVNFTYPVKGIKKGYQVWLEFCNNKSQVLISKIIHSIETDENILKYIIVKVDEIALLNEGRTIE